MRIDKDGVRARMKATGRKPTAWCMAKGHNPGTFFELMAGRIPVPKNMDTPSGRIIADLKADDLLVELEETEEVAA
jgi:hypothetical protein